MFLRVSYNISVDITKREFVFNKVLRVFSYLLDCIIEQDIAGKLTIADFSYA